MDGLRLDQAPRKFSTASRHPGVWSSLLSSPRFPSRHQERDALPYLGSECIISISTYSFPTGFYEVCRAPRHAATASYLFVEANRPLLSMAPNRGQGLAAIYAKKNDCQSVSRPVRVLSRRRGPSGRPTGPWSSPRGRRGRGGLPPRSPLLPGCVGRPQATAGPVPGTCR